MDPSIRAVVMKPKIRLVPAPDRSCEGCFQRRSSRDCNTLPVRCLVQVGESAVQYNIIKHVGEHPSTR